MGRLLQYCDEKTLIMPTKICTKCGEEKDTSEFYIYNTKCKTCCHIIAKDRRKTEQYKQKQKLRWKKYMADELFKLKKQKYDREYQKQHYVDKKEYNKHRQSTTIYKEYQHKYYILHKTKYRLSNIKYKKKIKEILADNYIIDLLTRRSILSIKDIKQYPKLIEAKRIQLKIIRELKQVS